MTSPFVNVARMLRVTSGLSLVILLRLTMTDFDALKKVIVNLNKITKLKPEVTRNILATLTNGEVIVISRRNVKALKELIGVEG